MSEFGDLPFKDPETKTIPTVIKFRTVKMLFRMEDSRTPADKITKRYKKINDIFIVKLNAGGVS